MRAGALLALALGLILPASALAATFVVNSSADDDVCDAITEVQDELGCSD